MVTSGVTVACDVGTDAAGLDLSVDQSRSELVFLHNTLSLKLADLEATKIDLSALQLSIETFKREVNEVEEEIRTKNQQVSIEDKILTKKKN